MRSQCIQGRAEMKVLVTGADGFVGGKLVATLGATITEDHPGPLPCN